MNYFEKQAKAQKNRAPRRFKQLARLCRASLASGRFLGVATVPKKACVKIRDLDFKGIKQR